MTDQPPEKDQKASPSEGPAPAAPVPPAPAAPEATSPEAVRPRAAPSGASRSQAATPAGQGSPAQQAAGDDAPASAEAAAAPSTSLLAGIGPKEDIWGTGRRKTSVARVRIRPGSGKFLINKREVDDYFKSDRDRQVARSPLETAGLVTTFDIWANVRGGGPTGQADAVKLGLARALAKAVPEITVTLREKGLLTRDARIKERKKYGRRGARRGMQWAKR